MNNATDMDVILDLLTTISQRHFLFDTLETRRTADDFREIAVWFIKYALLDAFFLGQAYDFNCNPHSPPPQTQRRKRRRSIAIRVQDFLAIQAEVTAGKTVEQACLDNRVSETWYYAMARIATGGGDQDV